MALCTRFLTTAVLVAGLGIAPAAYAEHWHGGGNNYHQGGGNYHRGGGGNAAGAAIIGGIIGLGVGAAIASQGYYGAPPPPVYYGSPPALLLRTATARLLRLLSRLPPEASRPGACSDNVLPNRGQHQTEERSDEDNPIEPSCFCNRRCAAGAFRRGTGATRPVSRTSRPAGGRILVDDLPPRSGQEHGGTSREPFKQLHAQLQITPAEQPQWDQFAQVMRENARDMDQAFLQRAQQYPTMNAMQNMQSYEQMAEAHVQHLQKLVPAFDNLYNAMPEQQKKLTDQVFRANAERHAAQSRHGMNATATAK